MELKKKSVPRKKRLSEWIFYQHNCISVWDTHIKKKLLTDSYSRDVKWLFLVADCRATCFDTCINKIWRAVKQTHGVMVLACEFTLLGFCIWNNNITAHLIQYFTNSFRHKLNLWQVWRGEKDTGRFGHAEGSSNQPWAVCGQALSAGMSLLEY